MENPKIQHFRGLMFRFISYVNTPRNEIAIKKALEKRLYAWLELAFSLGELNIR